MKIFITGATGFIGKQVLEILKASKHESVCLVRKTNPSIEKLKSDGIAVFEGDVRDKSSIMMGMQGCDWVINLANVYAFWVPDKSVFEATNVEGTRNVMECAIETGVSKVIHVSSVVSFGKPSDLPITENSKPGPERFSLYAKTKYKGDQIALDLHHKRNLPLIMIYPVAVIGPGDPKASGEYVSSLVRKKLPTTVFGNSVLTWVYVKDVAVAIIKALEKRNNIGEKYLIGKHQVSLKDINKMISRISGVSLPFIQMPDFLAISSAHLFTAISSITKKPPPWGMSVDQIKTMKEGFLANGVKAEKELGISYTSIEKALEEQIAAL
jgi:nucleoside-diphosphate-sugar epimerase